MGCTGFQEVHSISRIVCIHTTGMQCQKMSLTYTFTVDLFLSCAVFCSRVPLYWFLSNNFLHDRYATRHWWYHFDRFARWRVWSKFYLGNIHIQHSSCYAGKVIKPRGNKYICIFVLISNDATSSHMVHWSPCKQEGTNHVWNWNNNRLLWYNYMAILFRFVWKHFLVTIHHAQNFTAGVLILVGACCIQHHCMGHQCIRLHCICSFCMGRRCICFQCILIVAWVVVASCVVAWEVSGVAIV